MEMETRPWNWCWLTLIASLTVVDSTIWLSGSISQGDDSVSTNAIDAVSIESLTLQDLEQIPIERAAQIIDRIYHINQAKHDIIPNFVPSASSIPVHFIKTNGQRMSTTLNNINTIIPRIPHFAITELDIFITGLPEIGSNSVSQSYNILIEAYLKRYNFQNPHHQTMPIAALQSDSNLMIIDLGATLTSIARMAMLDIRRTGIMITQLIIGWLKEKQSLQRITIPIHIMAHGIGAHVAGAIGNEYSRLLDQNIQRITALDPSKIFYRDVSAITGLKVGDADFIDVIHTSAYGLGTSIIMGDCDFFPNGPGIAVPGTDNMIAASMRAIDYFAESMIPGNEHNFPAIKSNSLSELKQIKQGYRHPRTYMGIKTDLDIKGTFILEVNGESPYGQRTPPDRKPYLNRIMENT